MNGHSFQYAPCPACEHGSHDACRFHFHRGSAAFECNCYCGQPDPYDGREQEMSDADMEAMRRTFEGQP